MNMLFIVSALIAAAGILSMAVKRTIFGVLVGVHLLFVAFTALFSSISVFLGNGADTQVAAFLIMMTGLAVLVSGFALSLRLFVLSRRGGMDVIRNLRH